MQKKSYDLVSCIVIGSLGSETWFQGNKWELEYWLQVD
jgi:hypothetical protein